MAKYDWVQIGKCGHSTLWRDKASGVYAINEWETPPGIPPEDVQIGYHINIIDTNRPIKVRGRDFNVEVYVDGADLATDHQLWPHEALWLSSILGMPLFHAEGQYLVGSLDKRHASYALTTIQHLALTHGWGVGPMLHIDDVCDAGGCTAAEARGIMDDLEATLSDSTNWPELIVDQLVSLQQGVGVVDAEVDDVEGDVMFSLPEN